MTNRLYDYICRFRFSNKKHRTVEDSIPIMCDAPFLLKSILVMRHLSKPILLQVFDSTGRPLTSELAAVFSFPLDVDPGVLYPAGSRLTVIAKLPDGLEIGRSRLAMDICFRGFKQFRDRTDDVPVSC
jgi:hypothetical protein